MAENVMRKKAIIQIDASSQFWLVSAPEVAGVSRDRELWCATSNGSGKNIYQ